MKERKTIRLPGYDYSSDNIYFVTSCVHNRVCCFGEITVVGTGRDLSLHDDNAKIIGTGRDPFQRFMVENEYGKIAEKQWYWLGEQYPYVILHAFVVMPNHIHGLIEISRSCSSESMIKIKSLSELMGAYKTTVSKQIHSTGFTGFAWQRSFFENIIRNEKAFENILEYINSNPANWGKDNLHI
jgi:REP element-mobilizing transposase RayT